MNQRKKLNLYKAALIGLGIITAGTIAYHVGTKQGSTPSMQYAEMNINSPEYNSGVVTPKDPIGADPNELKLIAEGK